MTYEEALQNVENCNCADCICNSLQELHKFAGFIGHWIPVEERLPEPYKLVLITYYSANDLVADIIAYVDEDGDWFDIGNGYGLGMNIVAWMPLPEPYGKEENND